MSDDHSDAGATEHEADHAELNLPRETVEEQIRTSEDIRKLPGAIDPGALALDQEEQHRSGSVKIRSPGSFCFRTPTPPRECRDHVTHAGKLRRVSRFPGIKWTAAGDGVQTNSNPYADVRARHVDKNRRDQSQAGRGKPSLTWSCEAVLTDQRSGTSVTGPR